MPPKSGYAAGRFHAPYWRSRLLPSMTQAFMDDEDAVEDKLSAYYECIVEG